MGGNGTRIHTKVADNGISKCTKEVFYEHWRIVNLCVKILRAAYKPAGFNIGINMGKVAGAGVEKHIHTHIVPRWAGDTSFMQVTADVKVIPQGLAETYEKLKSQFPDK